ncbi:MAG: hypothetical protein IJP31_00975 [Lachnospiraceae bacterium]|nr:hypothetical protein [Lachnospiraceae bacterium]
MNLVITILFTLVFYQESFFLLIIFLALYLATSYMVMATGCLTVLEAKKLFMAQKTAALAEGWNYLKRKVPLFYLLRIFWNIFLESNLLSRWDDLPYYLPFLMICVVPIEYGCIFRYYHKSRKFSAVSGKTEVDSFKTEKKRKAFSPGFYGKLYGISGGIGCYCYLNYLFMGVFGEPHLHPYSYPFYRIVSALAFWCFMLLLTHHYLHFEKGEKPAKKLIIEVVYMIVVFILTFFLWGGLLQSIEYLDYQNNI